MRLDSLTLFGLLAVSAMLVFYAFESRGRRYTLGFAGSCLLGSLYGFLQGAWPFGLVEGIWAVVALVKWRRPSRRGPSGPAGEAATTEILVIGTVRLPPGTLAVARPAMERMVFASRAEVGCLAYGYAEDVLEPGLVHVKEIWRDRVCLDAHFATDHIAAWRATWPALGITDRDLALYEVAAPRPI